MIDLRLPSLGTKLAFWMYVASIIRTRSSLPYINIALPAHAIVPGGTFSELGEVPSPLDGGGSSLTMHFVNC